MADPYRDVTRSEMLAAAEESEPIDISGADWETDVPWRAVLATTTGVIVCRLVRDSADRTLPILAGYPTPYRVKLIRSASNGTTATGLFRLN